MAEPPPSTLRLSIDADALAANWRALDRMSGAAATGAAVKADGYGLGIDRVVPVLRDAGAEAFFVAHWSEVAPLLAHVPAERIAVLHGCTNAAEAAYARSVGARPVLNSLRQAADWVESGGGVCHLMVDTGINRLGIAPRDAGDPAIAALEIDVLLSHLACADEDSAMNEAQRAAFGAVLPAIAHRRASLANSAGIALGPGYHLDMTRPGLALYGGVPCDAMDAAIRQVAFPQAAILQRRSLRAGETVGYNALFAATRAMEVATVSIGYADGFLRAFGNRHLARDGIALPILGRISMDIIVVDCSAIPYLVEGDWLDLPWRLPDAARQLSVSQYELLTLFGSRYDRVARPRCNAASDGASVPVDKTGGPR